MTLGTPRQHPVGIISGQIGLRPTAIKIAHTSYSHIVLPIAMEAWTLQKQCLIPHNMHGASTYDHQDTNVPFLQCINHIIQSRK